MARPLEYTPPTPTDAERVQSGVEGNADALLDALKLLQALHEHGVLRTTTDVVRGGSGLVTETLRALESEASTRALRNAAELVRGLGTLDPREVSQLGQALAGGVREGARRAARGDGVGLGELLGLLRDRDVQLALGALFGLLQGFGRALRDARGETERADAQHPPGEARR
ncbi:DUF1641 domain-containing protein [Deinococcus maricopensis]|uniref:DUF1641 domain-containing protein n=1 Tax=Deinococcus maricopensis (strain DSM 21211 / LMG 22137 / NRRL B-23946 / LB-34) TaxID=709986 RepID=E8U7D6_DEIML|nr:DUF1641 domain-containing protein [Deinococcus maricopensis]ADV66975.1 protein of unknown function DUF1641 [Deinococcus maricopensis DSM 21211]